MIRVKAQQAQDRVQLLGRSHRNAGEMAFQRFHVRRHAPTLQQFGEPGDIRRIGRTQKKAAGLQVGDMLTAHHDRHRDDYQAGEAGHLLRAGLRCKTSPQIALRLVTQRAPSNGGACQQAKRIIFGLNQQGLGLGG